VRSTPNDVLALLARLANEGKVDLNEALTSTALSARIENLLSQARVPIRLHGKRVEEMFVYVAAALGGVRAVKREETDDFVLAEEQDVVVPDFRVVLADGSDILIEVKNVNLATGGRTPKAKYLRGLAAYGKLFGRPVYLATYWPRWRNWTLHSVTDLLEAVESRRVQFTFGEAYSRSQMRMLGDVLLGTRFPLTFRLDVESQVLKRESKTSEQLVRISEVSMSVAGALIREPRDREIAFGLMQYGRWDEAQVVATDGDRVTAIEFAYSPIDHDSSQDFAPIAALSTLASAQFNALTTEESRVTSLRPKRLPAPPYPTIDEPYLGVDLPLWKLILEPGRRWVDE
jgi:hypothetical protein